MDILFTSTNKVKNKLYEKSFQTFFKNGGRFNIKETPAQSIVGFGVDYDGKTQSISQDKNFVVTFNEELYIEGLPDDKQPGPNFRKVKVMDVDGNWVTKEMNDKETVEYYAKIVEKLGGSVNAKVVDDVIVTYEGKEVKRFKVENEAIFTSKPSKVIDRGNPLNSLTLVPEFGDIYYSECGEDEKNFLHELKGNKIGRSLAKAFKSIEVN